MKKNKFLKRSLIMAFAPVLFLTGCGDDDDDGPAAISGTSPVEISRVREVDCSISVPETTINVQNFAFSPASETIRVNQIIKWKNNDTVAHTATSGAPNSPDGKFDISLAPGQEKCAVFTEVANYSYYCKPHPNMTGTINVQADDNPSDGDGSSDDSEE